MTHNAKGDVLDGYTSWEWAAMCEAVSCLRIEIRRAEVVAMPAARAVGDEGEALPEGAPDAPNAGGLGEGENPGRVPRPVPSVDLTLAEVVEAAGVEPASVNVPQHCLLRA